MATFKNGPGQGVLYINDKKTTEKQPDYRGELVLDQAYGAGSTINIAGWKKTTPKNHLISIRIDQKQDGSKQWPKPVGGDDNDVPF